MYCLTARILMYLDKQFNKTITTSHLIGPQVGVDLAVVGQVAEGEAGHGAAEGHVPLRKVHGAGEGGNSKEN